MTNRRSHIVLMGFMGSGKSTVGSLLARNMDRLFIDMDQLIVEKEKMSISNIFEEKGETYFRKIESEVLQTVLNSELSSIISTGGGTPCFFGGINYINKNSFSFYLKVGRGAIFKRIQGDIKRPLINNKTNSELKQFIDESIRERVAFYKQANQTILAYGQPDKIVKRILYYLDKENI